MEKYCKYLEAALEDVNADVDMEKICFQELCKKLKVNAARGICKVCKKLVNVGEFKGASVGSLTDMKIT